MNELERARQEIDLADREMAALYERRMQAVEAVLEYKVAHGLPVLDASREERLLRKNAGYITNPDYVPGYVGMLEAILAGSRAYQERRMGANVVGYQGIEGAFSHMVASELFPDQEKRAFADFEGVFKAVAAGAVSFGIIPFENTNSGLVGEVLDLLAEYPVYIQEAWDQKIEQVLLGVPGASLRTVEWVYSKDQALAQAKSFLAELGAEPVAYPNTALAAQYVARENDVRKAAIGAKENAVLYGLEVLSRHIMEDAKNTTRFLVIGARPRSGGSHASLVVTLRNEVGALARMLEAVSSLGLDMCSIQSRPRKGRPFEYMFYIELVGERLDFPLLEEGLSAVCEQVKFLGAYSHRKEV